jgi:hypothetical protein
MTKFHSDDYIEFLNRITPEHTDEIAKYQAKFNLGEDCPIWDGLYEFCALSSGGSVGKAHPVFIFKALPSNSTREIPIFQSIGPVVCIMLKNLKLLASAMSMISTCASWNC